MHVPAPVVDHRIAGLTQRASAGAFDFAIVGCYILVLLVLGVVAHPVMRRTGRLAAPLAMEALAFLTLVLPVILYFALQEGSHRGATWGKRRAGIAVVGAHGTRLGYRRSLLREAVKFLPWQLAHTCVIRLSFGSQSSALLAGAIVAQLLVGVYALCLWLSRNHRTPYDWIAGAYVMRR